MTSSAEPQSTGAFEYEPLDSSENEIRVIRFVSREKHLREGFSLPLKIELFHVSLNSAPRYHALSYVWGSRAKPDMVLVNEKTMHITRSLYEALLRFNVDESVELLWADAISINQSDLDERSVQVRRMRHIYTSAVRVLAFLGTPPSGREMLVEQIALQGREIILKYSWDLFPEDHVGYGHPDEMPTSHFWKMVQNIATLAHKNNSFLASVASDLGLGSVDGGVFPHRDMLYFLRRPLWTRVWILKEFTCAKDLLLVCGLSELKFVYFIVVHWIYMEFYEWKRHTMDLGPQATQYISALAAIDPYTSNALLAMQTLHRWDHMEVMRHKSFRPLRHLLNNSFRLGASNPRDRVYAMLCIASDASQLGIVPDYTKTVADVYIDTAWRLLLHGHFVLDNARGLRESLQAPDLPSWVPDWSLRIIATLDASAKDADLRFIATAHTTMKIDQSVTDADTTRRKLRISGKLVATIINVGTMIDLTVPRETPTNLRAAQEFIRELKSFATESSAMVWPELPENRQYLPEALWRVAIARRVPLGNSAVRPADSLTMVSHYRHIPDNRVEQHLLEEERLHSEFEILSGKLQPPEELSIDQSKEWIIKNSSRYFEELCRYADLKRPLLCSAPKAEFLGMGPGEMEAGDTLCLFEGAHMPFVLRPTGENTFQLVGEAYVYGMMYGELIEDDPREFDMLVLE
jgi:Heterokaryon incompatibility protein (HET)